MLSTPDRDLTLLAGSRALVTGATGFTGSLLTRKLVRGGATVVAIARSSSNTEPLHDVPIQWVRGDLSHDETVQRAVAGVQYVFNVAAAYREAKLGGETYYRVHVVGTQLLAQAALAQASLKRFVHVSTVAIDAALRFSRRIGRSTPARCVISSVLPHGIATNDGLRDTAQWYREHGWIVV